MSASNSFNLPRFLKTHIVCQAISLFSLKDMLMNSLRAFAFVPRLSIVVMLVLLASTSTRTLAQQYALRLPQPISGTEVGMYLDLLNCSREQQFVILEFHREYIEEYANWISNDHVPAALQLTVIDDVKLASDMASTFRRFRIRSVAIETALLARIEAILTSDQALLLPSIRQWRETNRLRQLLPDALLQVSPARVDLQRLLTETLSRNHRDDAVTAIVNEYQIASARILRSIVRLSLEAPIETAESLQYFDALLDEVMTEMTSTNFKTDGSILEQLNEKRRMRPILMNRWQSLSLARDTTVDHAWRGVLLETCKLSTLNHRYFEALRGAATDDVFRQMLLRYHRIGYLSLPSTRGMADEAFISLRNRNSADSIDPAVIAEKSKTYREAIDEILRQMRTRVDENTRKRILDDARIGPSTSKELRESLEPLWERYEQINTQALLDLDESALMKNPQFVQELMKKNPGSRRDRKVLISGITFKTSDSRPIISNSQFSAQSSEMWEQAFDWTVMPAPIRLDTLMRLENALEFDQEMRPVAELLYKDYRFDWSRAVNSISGLLSEYEEIYRLAMAGATDDSDRLAMLIDIRYEMYNDLLRVLTNLDAAFIDMFATLMDRVNQPLLGLWKQSRHLELSRPALLDGMATTFSMYGLQMSPGYGFAIDGSGPLRTDLFLLIIEEYDPASWTNPETISALSAYYATAETIVPLIHSASMGCRQLLEKIYCEQMSLGEEGTSTSELDTSSWSVSVERICRESKRLQKLDRQAVEEIQVTMHENDANVNDLLDRYLARAFPRLVTDANLEITLRDALAKTSIDEIQRNRIEELYTTYLHDSRRDMHDILRLAGTTITQYSCKLDAPENLKSAMSFMSSFRAMLEKRKLLESNTRMRLSVVLGDEQATGDRDQ